MGVFVRIILAAIGLILGFQLTSTTLELVTQIGEWEIVSAGLRLGIGLLGSLIGALLLSILGPRLAVAVRRAVSRMVTVVLRTPVQDLVWGVFGMIVGLVIANLLAFALSSLPALGPYLPITANVLLGYIGMTVGIRKREELTGLVPFFKGAKGTRAEQKEQRAVPKILDTSAIIDGRIADISEAGFVEGTLIVPGFVLEELRHIADSADLLKRNRGRRGLDVLRRMQQDLKLPVQVYERYLNDGSEVDTRLVKLAKSLGACVVTNDYNLNKVCEVHQVRVLNIHELANAVKPMVLPGEEITVQVLKDGKEAGQGVAYLEDGTMIVVDGGKRHIGEHIGVQVTSVLQTSAGRMIFARPKQMMEKVPSSA